MLTGTGTAGAYHAGVLRALHEAGVKIDIVAGRGIGAIGAFFTAIDGGARLWDPGGLWRAKGATRLYGWRATLRAAAWTLGGALSVLLLPLAVLVSAVLVLPVAFLMRAIGLDGDLLASEYTRLVDVVFQPAALPVLLPRAVVVVLSVFLAVLVGGAVGAKLRAPARRRSRGAFWWSLLGTPLDVTCATEWFTDGLWQLMRGAAPIAKPSTNDLGGRYSELLGENVGQPGFRELIVVTHDVDARRDLTFALLAERHRRSFFLRSVGQEGGSRHLETMDLAGAAAGHAVDALVAALSLPVATEPHLLRFAPDSQWRGETHRVCDRPDATARVLEEVAHAGAEQVVLVSALPEAAGPHTLSSGHRDGRGRAGEHLAAVETAALRDAVRSCDGLFQAIFHIRPSHNPLGPFDFRGCYDELSDRRQSLVELVDRGYEDGFRQFVDSVVGASGELIESSQAERRGEGPPHQGIAT